MDEGIAAGARARQLALLLGIGLTTLQRWRRQFAGDGGGVDCRKGSHRNVSHRLSAEERQRILLTCNEPEFAALPPGQIVPILADRGLFIGSEHERKMSSIDPATEQSLSCVSRRSVILLMEDSRVIGVCYWRLIFALCGRAWC